MSAMIERSLYVGITKSRFDLWDEVRIELKNEEIVKGTIIGFEEEDAILLEIENTREERRICVDDIENCFDIKLIN